MIRGIHSASGVDHILVIGDDDTCYKVDIARGADIGKELERLSPQPAPKPNLVSDRELVSNEEYPGVTRFEPNGRSGFTAWTNGHPSSFDLTGEELATIGYALRRFGPN
jgi:hypothetical protein